MGDVTKPTTDKLVPRSTNHLNTLTRCELLSECLLLFADGEHLFLDLDVKLAKYAPAKWKEEVTVNLLYSCKPANNFCQ